MLLLITERDPLVRRWLSSQSEGLGLTLRFVDGPAELWLALSQQTPDCLVLEASSAASGAQPLWETVRLHPAARQLPVLVYASSQKWQAVAERAGRSLDGYLPKPFTPATLLKAAGRARRQRLVSRSVAAISSAA
ncbi:MAG: hypothetical protein IT371_20910 [Deltaproteobacteria bacterium]|nr:hypothetical protein [Deltaproteobacteria bacterium]